jgi:Domain of unknown function (DUF4145)
VTDATHDIQAPCSTCLGKTRHAVLFQKAKQDEQCIEKSALIECRGCGKISMGWQRVWTDYGDVDDEFYPAPITRRQPRWVLDLSLGFYGKDKQAIGAILAEVYQAIANGQRRLAAMGIRAALEQVMIATVGDLRTFDEKLDAFQDAGYISLVQRDAMRATLNVGDAAMHRGHSPSDEDLNLPSTLLKACSHRSSRTRTRLRNLAKPCRRACGDPNKRGRLHRVPPLLRP